MLKKKIGKIVTASAVTACVLVNATAAMLPSMSMVAFAGQELGQTDFNDGVGLPWHICESGPGKMKFNIDGGTYNIEIVEPGGAAKGGESRWDCQFRHRGLILEAGHTYEVKAEVTADHDGQIYTKIGDSGSPYREPWHNGYGGNEGNGWNCMQVTANKTLKIESTFTCTENIEVGEWAWQFGGAGQHQSTDCFPAGTKLKFDNMSLIDKTDDKTDYDVLHPKKDVPEGQVRVNQVGYFSTLQKQATAVVEKGTAAQKFSLLDASGKEVYTGTSSATRYDEDSQQYIQVLDFSDFTTAGTYTISCGGKGSYSFKIGNDVYDGILTDAVNYFYQNRSGIDLEEKYITSTGMNESKADLVHVAGHVPDTAYIQSKWVKSYKADGSDVDKSSGTLNGQGGWYDAGDHGKYVVNGGISIWTLNNMYERVLDSDNNSKESKWADNSGTVVIPENGNKIPDILDETKVEMDWMMEMVVPSGYKMTYDASEYGGADTGKYENMVFHKLHDHKWTGLGVRPNDYADEWGTIRIVKPPSTAATLNFVANAAQTARLWKDIDSDYADKLLAQAKLSYEAAKANPELYAPLDQAIGGGAYGDTNVKDDFYWAACELYATTQDATYLTDMKGYADCFKVTTNLEGGENNGSFSSFNWGNTAGLGSLTMYLNRDILDAADAKTLSDSIKKAADTYIAKEEEQGYGIPYQGATFTDAINLGYDDSGKLIEVNGYEWGSNSFVVNNAIVMAYAYDITKDAKYIDGVSTAMDYVFGRNALDFSYVTGYGTYHCENPHHRFWSHELDSTFPYAPSGVMSGGANSGIQDPYVRGMGYKLGTLAPQLCYIDSVEAWSVNEVTINWNSPFAWVVSFLEDEAPLVDRDTLATTAKTTEGGTTSTTTSTGTALYGDVDCNGKIEINDIVLLSRYVAQDAAAKAPTAQGLINADCEYNGTIDAGDITAIARYLAHLCEASELGPQ